MIRVYSVVLICTRCGWTDLPPVEVLLVKDLQDVSAAEAKPRLFTGNQVVVGGVVVEVTPHKGLQGTQKRELR